MSVIDIFANPIVSDPLSVFDGFAPESPLWVYVASKPLTDVQASQASRLSNDFITNWQSHGAPVQGGFGILDNQILLFGADARVLLPSGCSLDSLTGHLRNLSNNFGIDFFGRLSVLVWQADGHILSVSIAAFKQGIGTGLYGQNTLIFDHSINSCSQLEEHSKIPAKQTWLKKYFLG